MKAPRFAGVLGPVAACLLLHAAWAHAGPNDQAAPVTRAGQRDVIQVTGGVLTVNVDRSPLATVLDVIARQSGVSIRCDAPIAGTVTVNLRGIAVDEALTRILGPRSAVFVYSNTAATGRKPRLVEVRIYADPAGWPASPATPPEGRPWPAEAGDVASLEGADSTEHQPDRRRPAAILGQSRTLSDDPDLAAQARTAIALGRIGLDEAIAHPAVSTTMDPLTAVREAAAPALGRAWSEHAIASLIQALLEDHRFFVREAAAQVLGELWGETVVEALARALSLDRRQSVREAAAEALGKIGDPGAAEVLVGALGDVHSTVRESAATALGAIGHPEALGALTETARTDPDPGVRHNAEAAVAKLKGHEMGQRHHHRRQHGTATDVDHTETHVR